MSDFCLILSMFCFGMAGLTDGMATLVFLTGAALSAIASILLPQD